MFGFGASTDHKLSTISAFKLGEDSIPFRVLFLAVSQRGYNWERSDGFTSFVIRISVRWQTGLARELSSREIVR